MVELLSEPLYILAQARMLPHGFGLFPKEMAHLPAVCPVKVGFMRTVCMAQARLVLQLRVAAEAAATLTRGVLTLALLKASGLDVGIALSLAQVGYSLGSAHGVHASWLSFEGHALSQSRWKAIFFSVHPLCLDAAGICGGDAGGLCCLLCARLSGVGRHAWGRWRQGGGNGRGGQQGGRSRAACCTVPC